jgi:uncharacterized protein
MNTSSSRISRRTFLRSTALASTAAFVSRTGFASLAPSAPASDASASPLEQFDYSDVTLNSPIHEKQLQQTRAVLMELNEDSLLKPFRQMAGQPAPGSDLGGWYNYDPDSKDIFQSGFAPGCTFGQWISALARSYAIDKSPETREKTLRLNRLYAKTIDAGLFRNTRFPAYCYDKLVCGLIDSQKYAGDADAFAILDATTKAAMPNLPPHAIEHGQNWRPGKENDPSYSWDESYTMPENLFLAYERGAGEQYKTIGVQYLNNTFYERLAAGQNDLAGRHAYSHVNCLSSSMQAYLTLGDEKYLRAAKNGFDIVLAQSYATGGWGPDEAMRVIGSSDVYDSLTKTHASFETPCGSYGHFKVTRYLLRVTRDSRYGDSMERVMYNTVLGSLPLEPDGRAFYYSDYNFKGKKVYHEQMWPCCSGTLPQVAADYRINAYFRDHAGVYVNLYIPSSVRWTQGKAEVVLTQKGEYPYDSHVEFEVKTSKHVEFAMNLRIPAWAEKASIAVNGKRQDASAGSFSRVHRKWKNGDRIDVELPFTTRLEAIDAQHPETVALMMGPLVLFAIGDSQPAVTRAQLLAANKIATGMWQVQTAEGTMKMLPFTAIEDQPYATYLRVG